MGVDGKSIRMWVNNNLVQPDTTSDLEKKDYTLIYNPPEDFKYNQDVEIRVEALPMYDDLIKMVQELRLETELSSRHPEKDVQRLANSFRIILDINNNCCNTRTKVKDIISRIDSLKVYLTENEFVGEVEVLQRRFAAELFEEEYLREEHVRELKSFCTRFTEMWGATFMK